MTSPKIVSGQPSPQWNHANNVRSLKGRTMDPINYKVWLELINTAPNAEAKVKILQQFATEVRREARNQAQNILQKVHRELDAILL